jgi:hypothetical protein
MRVWYLMWYLADAAAVSGDETDLLPDEHICSRTEGRLRASSSGYGGFCQNSVHKVKSEPNSAVNIDAFVLKTLTSDANFKAKNRAER